MRNDWINVPVDYSDVMRRAMESLFETFENLSEGTFIVDADARGLDQQVLRGALRL